MLTVFLALSIKNFDPSDNCQHRLMMAPIYMHVGILMFLLAFKRFDKPGGKMIRITRATNYATRSASLMITTQT